LLLATAAAGRQERTDRHSASPIRAGHGHRAGSGSNVGTFQSILDRVRGARRIDPGAYPEEPEVERYAPRKYKLHLTPPSGPQTAAAPARKTSRAAADDFEIFRQTVVTATDGSESSEPTITNDRNGIIATGNLFARTSSNDGLSFGTDLEPFDDPVDGVGPFCCDQIAYAVDRGGSSLIFWLQQYRYCGVGDDRDCTGGGSANENALRLTMFRGRDDMLDGSDYCQWGFKPQETFDLDDKLWFDFNHVSHTSKYLYLTTNVRDEAQGSKDDEADGPRVGSLIWRMSLDDLDDGNCQVGFRYWYRDGDIYVTTVQNAGSTMYMATTRAPGLEGRKLRILSVGDGSNTLEVKDKDVKNWEYENYKCKLPDGDTGICDDMHAGRMSGWRSGKYVGWMWTAAQDNEFPFPQIRVAVFETGSLNRVEQHEIWNEDFAWMYAFAGVNGRGDLGVILYAIGGGRNPEAQAFIRTDPTDWDGIQMHSIADSNAGAESWGHYARVMEYGNCTNTFLGMAWVMDGDQASDRMVWFGDEDDGCEDLSVTKVARGSGAPFDPGETIHAEATVQNQGSATAASSKLAYYLSRDAYQDDDDDRLKRVTIGSLAAGSSVTDSTDLETPDLFGNAAGTYYLIACADDTDLVDEISDTNNCRATGSFEVNPAERQQAQLDDRELTGIDLQAGYTPPGGGGGGGGGHLPPSGGLPSISAGTTLTLRDTVAATGRRQPAGVDYVFSRAAGPDDDQIRLTSSTVRERHVGRRTVTRRRIVIPKQVPPGPWFLLGCVHHSGNDDTRAANDCRSVRVFVQSPATVTVRRLVARRQ
jgi:hypothetical protein